MPDASFVKAQGFAVGFVGADLTRANFSSSKFTNSDFAGAALHNAYLDGLFLGCRNLTTLSFDRRSFMLAAWRDQGGNLRFNAGCRCFTLEQAVEHWGHSRYHDPNLGQKYVAACLFLKDFLA